jgi:hypothetical protein
MNVTTAVALAALTIGSPQVVDAQAASAMEIVLEQPFYVDSGDKCPRGYTEGLLVWDPDEDYVDVVGDVVDRADPEDSTCGDDGMYTVATFTIYELGIPEVVQKREADNSELRFAMPVDGNTTEEFLDPVTIQVCRVSPVPAKSYCGKPQQFKAAL